MKDHARFIADLASFSRLTVIDRRGTGCSERLSPAEATTLEDDVADLVAVARATQALHSALFAVMESGFCAMMAAAMHPERFRRLILFQAAHTWLRSDDAPWQWTEDQWEDVLTIFAGPTPSAIVEGYIRGAVPTYAGDPVVTRQLTTLFALTQAPGSNVAEARNLLHVNLRDLVPTITVPTLVLHRPANHDEPVESARYLAEHIPNATLMELPGEDTLPWVGESEAVLESIERFLTGTTAPSRGVPTRSLATVLFTDIVGSTQRAAALGDAAYRDLLEEHHRAVRRELARHGGVEIDTAGDGFLATFDGPARAIECGLAISSAVRALGIEVRAGVHTGEVETINEKVAGLGVHIGARVSAVAGPSELFVSSTVRDLVAGSGLELDDAGEHELKGVPGRWRLYRVRSQAE